MNRLESRCSILVAAILALGPATIVSAQGTPDKDLAEIQSYRLSESGLAKYTQAVRSLGKLSQSKASLDEDDEDAGPKSLDEQVALYDAIPEVKQAIRSAGLTTREYTVFSWSLFQAGMASWALSQPGGKLPPGGSMDNVTFYRKHEAALNELKKELDAADPGSDDDDDEGEDVDD